MKPLFRNFQSARIQAITVTDDRSSALQYPCTLQDLNMPPKTGSGQREGFCQPGNALIAPGTVLKLQDDGPARRVRERREDPAKLLFYYAHEWVRDEG